ncbi:macrophage mannose receptor 1-like [Grus japonensis]|uniref:Macrophage mannose receptor 1-like n=1 Tax=Grus japonensis TaxID=30415 RepID=A0ABC9WHJ1_GRUJA
MALKLCLGVLTKDDEAAITLESCNRTNELQWWECRNEMLATHGKDLFFNYGKGKGKKIRLSKLSGKGSRWKIHGTTESVCSQRYEGLTSDLGVNAKLWTGLFSALDSGWQWIGGSPFRYLNWAPGNPSVESGKICGTFQGRNGKWENHVCDRKLGYICQKRNSSLDFSIIASGPDDELWIGLNDFRVEMYFEWSDGTPVTYTKWHHGEPTPTRNKADCIVMKGEVNFEKWANGEPNNYDGNEKCGVFNGYNNMNWNDLFCEHMQDYVCQIKKDYEHIVSEDDWIIYNHKEYYFSKEPMPMEKARDFCKKNGGDLAVIESETEKNFLWKYIFYKDWGNNFYIGLSVSLDKTFRWMDGTPVNYVAWAPNEPNFANNDENCVVMYTQTGTWNDLNCGSIELFICERLNTTVRPTVAPTSPPPKGGCPEDWLLFDNKDDCVFMLKNPIEQAGKWKDEECKTSKSYICQKSSDPKLQNFQPLVPMFGFNNYGDDRYAVINYNMSWEEAQQNCRDQSAELASVLDPYAESYLWLQILKHGEPVWIGLNSNTTRGHYMWSDRRRSRYHNWASGEPNKNTACVYLDLDGFWKTASCNETFSSLCKQSDGEWIWTDRSEVEFVNWEKGEPTVIFDEHCVDMDVSSGTWRNYYCSVDQNFICKIPKIIEVEPTHDSPVNKGIGLTFYFFYKKRRDRQTTTASFDSAIYRGDADPGTHESNCLVTNIEQNEQATV